MSKIKVLPDTIANKIAAGEVVQRPESVVKELMENCIDAGATSIELLIRKAGKSLIQVIDNGEGMTEEDALLSIQKHATSKISQIEDLDEIKTLGFRGEALSSIAAVSQLEIKTETKDDELGTLIRIDDTETIHKEKGSFSKGTNIAVKNLFFNVPARRNFLKTDATELRHITDTFNRLALCNPSIAFKLYVDGDLNASYSAGTFEDRIGQVFQKNMMNALIPVEESTDFLSINGYVGKPTLIKKSKGDQYLFLNKRAVNSKQVNHAVFTAYENVLEKGDYPFFILFLDLDPKRIDVNVHPSKLEVRFDDERSIYNLILTIVRKSLSDYDLVPSLSFSDDAGARERMRFDNFTKQEKQDFGDRPYPKDSNGYQGKKFTDKDIDMLFDSLSNASVRVPDAESKPLPFEKRSEPYESNETKQQVTRISSSYSDEDQGSPFLVQLHNKYILSQIRSGLMIIDQHVAHERILYEKALHSISNDVPFAQPLLFPKTIVVDAGTFELVKELHSYLMKLGFEISFVRKNTIQIDGVPQDIKAGSEEGILLDIIDEYHINQREKELDEKHNVAASYSCKAAIKAGDKLSDKEMRVLIDELFATSMPYVCPHGRPIVVKISLDEFDKRFGRTS